MFNTKFDKSTNENVQITNKKVLNEQHIFKNTNYFLRKNLKIQQIDIFFIIKHTKFMFVDL